MHILFVGHENRANGASRSMINLIDELSDRCTFSVVLPYESGPTIDILRAHGVDVYFVPFRRWAYEKNKKYYIKKLLWNLSWDQKNERLAKQFAKSIAGEKIDIIHSNTSVIDFGARLSKIMNLPHIWHIREFGEKDFNIFPLVSYKRYFDTINRSNIICCISKAVSEKYKGKVSEKKIRMIYNGVGKENVIINKTYHNEGPLVCLQTGYINYAKGQDVSIRAIQELHRRGITDIKLLLAGKGNLERIGFKSDGVEGVELLGVVNNLPKIRKDVDVELVSSKSEAFGRVTVEAMMGGLAVVGSNAGGTPELLENEKTGLLYKQGSEKDLADKLEYLYCNRDIIAELGKNGQKKAMLEFGISRCANNIYQVYNMLLNDAWGGEKYENRNSNISQSE